MVRLQFGGLRSVSMAIGRLRKLVAGGRRTGKNPGTVRNGKDCSEMKITEIKVSRKNSPLTRPLRISLGTITHSTSIVAEVMTDEGIWGIGEGAASAFVTGETMDGAQAALKMLEEALLGVDPTDLEKVHCIMDRTLAHAPVAKAAVDIACFDLLGKKAGMPVYRLLGGHEDHLETDMTIGIQEPEEMARLAKEHVGEGFRILKTKVGTGKEQDLKRIRLIREAVGKDIKIRLDANQALQALGGV